MNEISNNIKSSSQSTKGLWIPFVVCIAIVAGTFNGMFSYFAFVLSIIAIFLLTEDNALCFMMMIMPFANIFKSSAGTQSFFTYLLLFYILCFFVKRRCISKMFLITVGFLSVYLVFQMCFSLNILRTVKFVANLLFIYLAVSCSTTHNAKKMCLYYIFGVAASSAVAALNIIPNLNNYIGTEDMWLQNEQVLRFTGMYADPNYYSVNLIISLCLIIILNHKKYLSIIPAICLGGLMTFFVAMTLSKSAFLMLVLPLGLLMYSKLNKRNYLLFFGVLVAGIVVVNLLFSGKIAIFNNVLLRITNASDIDSLTTGRSNIWNMYCEFLFDNLNSLLFGGGFGAELIGKHAAHNTYIDLIYYFGIIGTVLVLLVFGVLINLKKNTAKLNLLNYSIWICIALMYFFLSELFYFDWAFHIIIAICISKMNMSQTKEEKNHEKICV